MFESKKYKICIIGLGYVGLPLAIEFSKKFEVVGFDLSSKRVNELKNFFDSTGEIEPKTLKDNQENISFFTNLSEIHDCNIFIITVPTPVDEFNEPDMKYLELASKNVGSILKNNNIVIYESTVYPGATEEICIPILEKESKLKFNKDFYVGYSPERINPGDKEHRLPNIKKITSGSTEESAKIIYELYSKIITAGVYMASSIKVAEAAKVIENTQRDINIALMNELALIFDILGIDTSEVLSAAGTKWNFLPFKPGLVGGHCIGVDPYYLSYKAQKEGYLPEIVLAGRKLNNKMAAFVAAKLVKIMIDKSIEVKNSKVLIMGLTFKENCPDIRNSKVFDVINELELSGISIDVYDPNVDKSLLELRNINLIENLKPNQYDGLIFAVKHKEFLDMGIKKLKKLCKQNCAIYDVTSSFNIPEVDERL
tara:strand:+ start:5319 stop:6596 length:1278 start_codon:yes stop_codon:yes gene_type:complete